MKIKNLTLRLVVSALFLLAVCYNGNAQIGNVPNTFVYPYQGVLRNPEGKILKSQTIPARIWISNKSNGTIYWEENIEIKTDKNGVFKIEIGKTPNLISQYSINLAMLFGGNYGPLEVALIANPPGGVSISSGFQIGNAPKVQYATFSWSSAPKGTIVAFAGDHNNIPEGWVACEGNSTPFTGEMATYLNRRWGGTGSTYNLPDLKGYFLMGVANGGIEEPRHQNRINIYPGGATGNSWGTYQSDSVGTHTHRFQAKRISNNQALIDLDAQRNPSMRIIPANNAQGPNMSTAHSWADYQGSETRPKNVAMIYIMKVY